MARLVIEGIGNTFDGKIITKLTTDTQAWTIIIPTETWEPVSLRVNWDSHTEIWTYYHKYETFPLDENKLEIQMHDVRDM